MSCLELVRLMTQATRTDRTIDTKISTGPCNFSFLSFGSETSRSSLKSEKHETFRVEFGASLGVVVHKSDWI